MKKIYFAGPMFNCAEKAFNLKIATILENGGYSVFLPQRDGFEAAQLIDKSEEAKSESIFNKDVSEILSADIFFMVLDGRVPDDGACVELGIAYASRKRCYGLKSDVRVLENNLELNPLIGGCFYKIFINPDEDALLKELRTYLKEHVL